MPSASLVKEFENLIGKENVFTSEADRQSYAYDAAVLPSVVPGLVLRPTSTEPVSYTHLDVYKRQGARWAGSCARCS